MVEARNFTFMFYGFLAAWLVVLVYVVSLARRGARLKKELEEVRRLFGTTEEERANIAPSERVR
jgi:CcmD family protein